MITANKNYGPVYGVDLINSLPLGTGVMTQAMPSRQDLANVRRVDGGERVAAGYEVLLSHYRNAVEALKWCLDVVEEAERSRGRGPWPEGDRAREVIAKAEATTARPPHLSEGAKQ